MTKIRKTFNSIIIKKENLGKYNSTTIYGISTICILKLYTIIGFTYIENENNKELAKVFVNTCKNLDNNLSKQDLIRYFLRCIDFSSLDAIIYYISS